MTLIARYCATIASLMIAASIAADDIVSPSVQATLDKQLEEQFSNPGIHRAGAPPPATVYEQAKKLHPSLELKYMGSSSTPTNDYVWSEYYYETPFASNQWPYGFIHVLWHLNSSQPIWSMDWGGDFQPHSRAWIDFDGDGQRDLFFFAGFEDVFATHLYLWRVRKNGFRSDALVEVYSNDNDYSVLVDMDNDGRPEILDSGHTGNDHVEYQCGEQEWDKPAIPESVRSALATEYRKLAKEFDQFNFNYNMPDAYPVFSISILDPIMIFRIEMSKVVDVTEQYPDHLLWRLNMLLEIRKANSEKCVELVDSTISYVEGRLAKVRSNQALHPDALTRAGERRRYPS